MTALIFIIVSHSHVLLLLVVIIHALVVVEVSLYFQQTKLVKLNGLELTLDLADVCGDSVPFEEFYFNFVDLTADDINSSKSPSVPEGDKDASVVSLESCP